MNDPAHSPTPDDAARENRDAQIRSARDEADELLVAEATDAYLELAQTGAEPKIEEFVGRYPQIADMLRRLLPAMRVMSGGKSSEASNLSGRAGSSVFEQGDVLDFSRTPRWGEDRLSETLGGEGQMAGAPAQAGQLGDFRLIREVGRGGMGVVYEAQQVSLGRRVALKVLPMAAALDSRQLQRFRMEAQAAAHLHHSNIVPIYSVGCERGVYYYAMQFIQGRSLAEVITGLQERHRPVIAGGPNAAGGLNAAGGPNATDLPANGTTVGGAGSAGQSPASGHSADRKPDGVTDRKTDSNKFDKTRDPSEADRPKSARDPRVARETVAQLAGDAATLQSIHSLSFFRSVAALGVQAAEALEYAHAMGVVHRDIKPANLLLGDEATVYVADFGLAQLQGDTRLTFTGDLVGTLRYMSPEQTMARRGLVDHRADIYSLGATLYELLTLKPVFDGPDRHALLREIAEEEPIPPRQQNKAIPVDLETIVLKALAKEPQRRYSTAKDMAEDLARFLDHRPITARPPTVPERATRWLRRHRTLVASALCLLVFASVGFGVSTALIAREQWKTQAAYNRLSEEQSKTQTAYLAEAKQRERAEKAFRQARQIVDFFTEVSEEELSDKPELQGLRRMMLAAALDYYQGFIADGYSDPSLQAQLAASHLRVGGILAEIGSSKADAMAALERAKQIQEKLMLKHPAATDVQNGLVNIFSRFDALRGGRELNLLNQKSVQEDLQLDEQQVHEVSRLWEQRRRAFYDLKGLTPEEWRMKFNDLATQEATLADLLRADQRRRLGQIALQQHGMHAFSDPEVAKALNLTKEQFEQLRPLQRNTRDLLAARFESGELRPEDWQAVKDSWHNAWEQVRGVLTDEQEARWKDLTGEPFKGKFPREGFPMRGGPWGHRGGPDGRGSDGRGLNGRGPDGRNLEARGPDGKPSDGRAFDRHNSDERGFDEHGHHGHPRHGSPHALAPPSAEDSAVNPVAEDAKVTPVAEDAIVKPVVASPTPATQIPATKSPASPPSTEASSPAPE